MTTTTSRPAIAHAIVRNMSRSSAAMRAWSELASAAEMSVSSLKIESTPLVMSAKYAAGLTSVAVLRASFEMPPSRLQHGVAGGARVGFERRPQRLVRFQGPRQRFVDPGAEELAQHRFAAQPLELLGRPRPADGDAGAEAAGAGQRFAQLGTVEHQHVHQALAVDVGIDGQPGGVAHVREEGDDARDHAGVPSEALVGGQLRRAAQEIGDAGADLGPLLGGAEAGSRTPVDVVHRREAALDLGALRRGRVLEGLIAVQGGVDGAAMELQIPEQRQAGPVVLEPAHLEARRLEAHGVDRRSHLERDHGEREP